MYSNAVIQGDGEDVPLECDSKGQIRYKEFVTERLIKNSERSMWDTMKKIELRTFPSSTTSNKCKLGDEFLEMKEERALLLSFFLCREDDQSL